MSSQDGAGGTSSFPESPEAHEVVRVAIDAGGTFTDAVGVCGDVVVVAKVPSTPSAPVDAVRAALSSLEAQLGGSASHLVHGTTVATNALLERDGAETWLVTNEGFEDLLAIGRQNREELYSLRPAARASLVGAGHVVGAPCRRDARGESVRPLDVAELRSRLNARRLGDAPELGGRSWAVCLLHSYASGADERAVRELLGELFPGEPVSLSHEVLPELREYERGSTTVANAFVSNKMASYLGAVDALVPRVDIMGSAGGRLKASYAADFPIHTALSGPAGGVVSASQLAVSLGLPGVIGLDMGGTSTDVAFCRGAELPLRFSGAVGDIAAHVPLLDIHTIGAGGGSIAGTDVGGALRVGPESAGANPGPACYGVGDEPTVTDANVVLGRMPAEALLAGAMKLDAPRAFAAFETLAGELGFSSDAEGVAKAARGVIDVAVELMAGAIRRISVERGVDPRAYPLCAFGGAGGLHACEVAERLGIGRVLVPARAGLFSAVGMLQSRSRVVRTSTVLGLDVNARSAVWSKLRESVDAERDGDEWDVQGLADCRFAGQSFSLSVPYDGDDAALAERFREAHDARFGYRLDSEVEVVALRALGEGAAPPPLPSAAAGAATQRIEGPSSVGLFSTTVYVPAGWSGEIYADGQMDLRRNEWTA